MSQKSVQIMLAENQEAKRILAELGALLGAATQPETSAPSRRKENMAITATKTVRRREAPRDASNHERLLDSRGRLHELRDSVPRASGV